MKHLIKRALRSFGVDVVRYPASAPPELSADEKLDRHLRLHEHLGFEFEDEAMRAIQLVKRNTMLPKRRLVTLYEQVVYCERKKLPGAFVECGVWKGGAVGLMAAANLAHSATRRHMHLFDVFDDICEPDPAVDGERALREAAPFADSEALAGRLKPLTGIYDSLGGHGTVDETRRLVERDIGYDPEYLHYHVGWFQDTIPPASANIGDVALLRLDGDWYASTKVCLDHLYDLVVPGGVIIVDDYAYDGCRKAVTEFLASRQVIPLICPIDGEGVFFLKQ